MNPAGVVVRRFPLAAAAVVWIVTAAHAQKSAPKLVLPVEPYDYTTTAVAAGLDASGLDWHRNTPQSNPITDHGATLGRVLFYDKQLSRNKKTSCASCHKQSRAFADPRRLSRGFAGRLTKRNALALANLRYHRSGRFFWDERGPTLEQMVLMPISDPIEMGLGMKTLLKRLNSSTSYRWLNRRAFGRVNLRSDDVARALAQFIRSMVSFRSKFDRGLGHAKSIEKDFANFSADENRGKRVFLGLHIRNGVQSCASCHMQRTNSGRTANDPLAPILMQGLALLNNGLDRGRKKDDPGRFGVTKARQDLGMFRTPSLRNIALTAPYMHDGSLVSLDDVVKFYTRGVRRHPSLDPRLITISSVPLNGSSGGWGQVSPNVFLGIPLSNRNRRCLVAFLRTLTDWAFVRDSRFSNPFQRR